MMKNDPLEHKLAKIPMGTARIAQYPRVCTAFLVSLNTETYDACTDTSGGPKWPQTIIQNCFLDTCWVRVVVGEVVADVMGVL